MATKNEWTVTEDIELMGGAYKKVRVAMVRDNIKITGTGIEEDGVIIYVAIDKGGK